jgi:DNA-binding GntR family transcriptional regulator
MSSAAATRERAGGPGTAAQHALEALRLAMVAGELRPGDRVRQEEIAEGIGVSIAPVREALATLEQEGQVRYLPRRGYTVAELGLEDLREIYELRQLLETRAARRALPVLEEAAVERLEEAARDCVEAAAAGDVATELEANRRFHFAVFEAPGQTHTLRLIRLLWDSTETYRAMYYNAPEGRREAAAAHERIVAAVRAGDAEALVAEQDAHRGRALELLTRVLQPPR